jgi:hypothetical protein
VTKKCDKELEDTAQSNYELGQVVVYESMWKELHKECGILFSNGNDEMARYVRRRCTELKEEAERMRKEYMEKWHPEVPK